MDVITYLSMLVLKLNSTLKFLTLPDTKIEVLHDNQVNTMPANSVIPGVARTSNVLLLTV